MKGKWIFLLVLYAISVVVRIYPVFVSSMPYNYDALLEARAGQFIGDHGSLNYPSNVAYNNHHTPVTPFLNALLGAIAQLTGVNVMTFLPYIFPFIVSIGVIGWYLLAKRITEKEEIAAFTGIMFALSGTYVLHTTLIWKQALGLALMPFVLYTYKRRNSVSLFLLILMPLVHHYVALITYIIITYEVLFDSYLKYHNHILYTKQDKLWIAAIFPLWTYFGLYYILRHFDRLSELSPSGDLWLFLSLFVVVYIASLKAFKLQFKGIKIRYYILVAILPIVIYAIYFFVPIFPHTPKFNKYTFIFTFGYLLLLPLITMGFVLLLFTEHKDKKLYLSTLTAPLQMILFFFLRGLDLESYVSISRTFDFTDFSWHTATATATHTLKKKLLIYVAVFLIISTTTPLTYYSMQAFGVNSYVYDDEYHTGLWIKTYLGNVTIDSDERIGHIIYNSFDIKSGYMLPYELVHGLPISTKYWVVSTIWYRSAQLRPMAPVKINVQHLLNENSVLFSTGRTYVVLNNTA